MLLSDLTPPPWRAWLLGGVAWVFSIGAQPAVPTPGTLQSPPPVCGGTSTALASTPELLLGYGNGGFPIATRVPAAQAFFDNGLQLAHAFAHAPAIAAMREAVRRDPTCAGCLWGEAWAAGPTLNYPIAEAEAAKLAALVRRADELARRGPEKERALIAALALRYPAGYRGEAVNAANLAYARAMDGLTRRWPQDEALAVLAAEAWLIVDPWNGATDHLPRALELLELVLARRPHDTAAIHYYIHATEFAGQAAKAELPADRLPRLAPAASHLIHMPSHTYFRIGRYADAVTANVQAARLGREDARLLGLSGPDAEWGAMYHAHNVRFGIGAALMAGDTAAALALSDPLLAHIATGRAGSMSAWSQLAAGTAWFAQGRFAEPRKVLAMAEVPARLPYVAGFRRYARGEAAARMGDAALVEAEARAITLPRGGSADSGAKPAAETLQIARAVLLGRAEMLRGKPGRAVRHFQAAAKLQEQPDYSGMADPPSFWYPVQRDVAAALIALRRGREAERAAVKALTMFPKDPEAEVALGRARALLRS